MAEWVLIENNIISEYHDKLPANWRNHSGLNLSANNEPFLNSLGWFKVIKVDNPNYIEFKHIILKYDYCFFENKVYETPIIAENSIPNDFGLGEVRDTFNLKIQLRATRDKMLQETDWTQLPDVCEILSEEEKNNYKNYRQYLRDLPNNVLLIKASEVLNFQNFLEKQDATN